MRRLSWSVAMGSRRRCSAGPNAIGFSWVYYASGASIAEAFSSGTLSADGGGFKAVNKALKEQTQG
jgi:hypothetical protein